MRSSKGLPRVSKKAPGPLADPRADMKGGDKMEKYFLLAVTDVVFSDGNKLTKLVFWDNVRAKSIEVWGKKEELNEAGLTPEMLVDWASAKELEVEVNATLGKKAKIVSLKLT